MRRRSYELWSALGMMVAFTVLYLWVVRLLHSTLTR